MKSGDNPDPGSTGSQESGGTPPPGAPQYTTPLPGYPPPAPEPGSSPGAAGGTVALPDSGYGYDARLSGQTAQSQPYPPYPPQQPGGQPQQPYSAQQPYGPQQAYPPQQPYPPQPYPPQPAQTPNLAASPPGSRYDARAARQAWRAQNRQHRVPVVGPLLLITAGVLFLLNNIGVLDWSVWGGLWQLWPLFFIIVGLDLLVGRRNPWLSLVLVVLVIAAGVWIALSGGFWMSGPVLEKSLSVPLSDAKAATVRIDMGIGDLRVDDGEGGSSLATGTLDYAERWGAPTVDTTTADGIVNVVLSQHSGSTLAPGYGRPINWQVHLNPSATIDLDINAGAGRADLDLEQLRVSEMRLASGVGSTSVIFPAKAGTTTAVVQSGAGSVNLEIPAGVEARIQVHAGLGSVNVDDRFVKSSDTLYESAGYNGSAAGNKLDLTINSGLGSVNIDSK